MAGNIYLNAAGLEDSATKLDSYGSELEQLIKDMQNVIDALPEMWEGVAATAYMEQFSGLRPGLDNARELVASISRQITQTLQASQELDMNISKQMG